MPEILLLGPELGGILVCLVVIAILSLAAGVIVEIDKAVPNPSIGLPGVGSWKPLNFIHDVLNAALSALQATLSGVEGLVSKLWSLSADSLTLMIGIPLLLALGVYDLFTLLLKHTLPALIGTAAKPVTDAATKAGAEVSSLEKTVADNLAKAKDYADAQASSALQTAKVYSATNLAAAANSLEAEIKSVASATANGIVTADLAANGAILKAIHAAIDTAGFATTAELPGEIVDAIKSSDAIRSAIAAAIPAVSSLTSSQVTGILSAALAPGGALLAQIEVEIPHVSLGGGVTAGEVAGDIASAIQDALNPGGAIAAAIAGAIPAVLPGVPSLPVPSLGDLATTVAGLGVAVAGIEAISFIGGESCRSNVSQLCGVNGGDLAALLGGLAAFGAGFSLAELAKVAESLAGDVADVIQQAA